MNTLSQDFYISVDIEAAGPNPSEYSLLTIGACTLADPPETFYVELQPVNNKLTQESFAIHRLDMKRLSERGVPPEEAMTSFVAWLKSVTPEGGKPVFVAFNAPYDWMFINDYFYRYLGHNPFGHTAVDIKAYYMGMNHVPWEETTMKHLGPRYLGSREITHHALRDAIDQAEIFRKMLAEIEGKEKGDFGQKGSRK